MKKKDKKKMPFNVLRKGAIAGLLGLTLGFGCLGLAGCSNGQDGKDGAQWYSGTTNVEFVTDGVNGDFYIDTDDYILYQKVNGQWTPIMYDFGKPATATNIELQVDSGKVQWRYKTGIDTVWKDLIEVDTITGADGNDGSDGEDGKDGREIELQVGSEYIQWRYTTGTDIAWKNLMLISSLKGTDGATWLSGNTEPTIAEGKNGDLYLNESNYDIYKKTDGIWNKVGNIKGADGKNGADSTLKQYGKYTCLGDSISYGAGSTAGNVSWCDYLAEQLGATLTKYAVSGQKIWENLRGQVEKVGADAELITLMMGVNDCSEISSGTKTLGEVDDVIMMENDNPENYEGSTLYNDSVLGRFRWCLERLKVKAPNARIVVITPLPYNDNATLKQLVQAQASICNAIGIEVLVPTDSVAFSTEYFQTLQSDTLHPNDAGYKVVAGYVYQNLGDVKYYESAEEFEITTNLTNISSAVGNVSYIKTGGVITLTFTANTGYLLPDSVSVTGASYTWSKNSGTLVLKNPTNNVTITMSAVEQEIETYSITFNINNHGEQPAQVNDARNLPETLPVLEATGYTFGGWYLDADFTNKAEAGAEITVNTTLYAKWIVEQLSSWASSDGTFGNANYFSQTNNWNEDVHVTKFCYYNGGEETITAQLFIYDTQTNTISKAYKFENIVPGENKIDVDFTMLASENWIVQVSKNSYWIHTPSGGSGIVICKLSSTEVGGTVSFSSEFAQYTMPANLVGTLINS